MRNAGIAVSLHPIWKWYLSQIILMQSKNKAKANEMTSKCLSAYMHKHICKYVCMNLYVNLWLLINVCLYTEDSYIQNLCALCIRVRPSVCVCEFYFCAYIYIIYCIFKVINSSTYVPNNYLAFHFSLLLYSWQTGETFYYGLNVTSMRTNNNKRSNNQLVE